MIFRPSPRVLSLIVLAGAGLSFGAPNPARAVDGFSVSTHWSGSYSPRFGGIGEIWRHDIADSAVTQHVLLYSDQNLPARNPVISPEGARVAVIRADGSLCVMPASGGDCVTVPGVSTSPEAFLDWSAGNWVYYAQGSIEQPTGSRLLHRVDVENGRSELVASFLKNDRTSPSGTWRVHVARDLVRAVVRGDNQMPEPFGRVTAVSLDADEVVLPLLRSTPRWRCAEGMSPDGSRFMAGLEDHDGFEIRDFATLDIEQTVLWADVLDPPPNLTSPDYGPLHNLNTWSANAGTWISACLTWAAQLGDYGPDLVGNQVLFDWSSSEAIVVTANEPYSRQFDDAGDFFVWAPDHVGPRPVSAWATGQPCRIAVTFDEPVDAATAQDLSRYAVTPDLHLVGASLEDRDFTVVLDCGGAELATNSVLAVQGIRDPAGNETREVILLSIALPTVPGELLADAGDDLVVAAGEAAFLNGVVTGSPAVRAQWQIVSAPGPVVFEHPDAAMTYAALSVEGEHVFELQAIDGDEQAEDRVTVLVTPARGLEILRPLAGQTLTAGSAEVIEWRATGVDDVRLDFSCDGGATFSAVVSSVDVTSPDWGHLAWQVPTCETFEARLRVSGYLGETSAESGSFRIVAAPANSTATTASSPRCDASEVGQTHASTSLLFTVLRLLGPGARI